MYIHVYTSYNYSELSLFLINTDSTHYKVHTSYELSRFLINTDSTDYKVGL